MFIGLDKKELHHLLSTLRHILEDHFDFEEQCRRNGITGKGLFSESELDVLTSAYSKVSDAFYSFDEEIPL